MGGRSSRVRLQERWSKRRRDTRNCGVSTVRNAHVMMKYLMLWREDLRKRLSEYTHCSLTRPPTPASCVAEPVPVDTPWRVETSDVSRSSDAAMAPLSPPPLPHTTATPRRGKAPPIDNGESNFEDWLQALQRSEDETLLQLAGHLQGRALEEWNMMDEGERESRSKQSSSVP